MPIFKVFALRLVLLAGALQAIEIGCVALITRRLGTTVDGLFSKPVSALGTLLVPTLLLAFAVYWAGVRIFERRPLRELQPRPFLTYVPVGVGGGFVSFALVFAAIAAHGFVTYTGYTGLARVPAAVLILTAGVVFEELIFRGTILRIAEESVGTAPALMLSALLFSASHLGNQGVTVIGTVALLAGGITLGLAYCLSRSLWLPIGAHLGWNFTMGALFGTAISGHEAQGAFTFALAGPEWITGGRFGPESSIYSMLMFLLLSAVLGQLARRRNDWTPIRFRRRAT